MTENQLAPTARLDIKVGFSCNNRCSFCVQGDKRLTIPDRNTNEIREILTTRRNRFTGVVFTGGEVTIRADLVDLVVFAKSIGYETIQIQTNGRRLSYLPYLRRLKEAGVTEIAPALHGSTPALHDSLVRSRNAFVQTVLGIRHSVAMGLPVITNSVVVNDNVTDLPALAKLLCNLGVRQIQLAFVHPEGTAKTHFNAVVPTFSFAMPYVKQALQIAQSAGVRAFTEAIPYCFMGGFEQHVVESYIPETCVVDKPETIESYTDYRWSLGKVHGECCRQCTHASICEGPWREYPEVHGWGEFIPRTDLVISY
ncbi:MAG: radical SAM protein [Myxococcales bacterium]|nr:radical SAM protein [Myxococcales bacterium]